MQAAIDTRIVGATQPTTLAIESSLPHLRDQAASRAREIIEELTEEGASG